MTQFRLKPIQRPRFSSCNNFTKHDFHSCLPTTSFSTQQCCRLLWMLSRLTSLSFVCVASFGTRSFLFPVFQQQSPCMLLPSLAVGLIWKSNTCLQFSHHTSSSARWLKTLNQVFATVRQSEITDRNMGHPVRCTELTMSHQERKMRHWPLRLWSGFCLVWTPDWVVTSNHWRHLVDIVRK